MEGLVSSVTVELFVVGGHEGSRDNDVGLVAFLEGHVIISWTVCRVNPTIQVGSAMRTGEVIVQKGHNFPAGHGSAYSATAPLGKLDDCASLRTPFHAQDGWLPVQSDKPTRRSCEAI